MNQNKEVINVLLEDIIPNRFQPRLAFDEKELNDLASSIKEHGIIQPLVLRKIGDKYEIIAGERRYKASGIAGLKSVPALLIEADDQRSAELAIVENIQRKNLTAIEEAQSYKKLAEKGMTQDNIAKKIGVTQATVANKIRLLSSAEEVQDALLHNKISERHARSLLSIPDETEQVNLLNKIIENKLTVKQTEDEISKITSKTKVEPLNFDDSKITKSKGAEIINLDEDQKFDLDMLMKPETINDNFMTPPRLDSNEELKTNQFTEAFESTNAAEEINTPQENTIKEEPISSMNDAEILDFDDEEDEDYEDIRELLLDNPAFDPISEEIPTSPLVEEFKQQKNENNIESLISENEDEEPREKTITDAINMTRDFAQELEYDGFNVDTEEFDFEDMYQIVIKIKKY